MSGKPFGETPPLEEFKYSEEEPSFLSDVKEPATFEDTKEGWEKHKESLQAVEEMSTEAATAARDTEGPLKPRPYKVGEANLDDYPTDTAGLRTSGEGPLDKGEINTLSRAGDDREKIRQTRKKLFH